ncbi:F-box/LRR-repeat protein 6-like [Panonychus citri]|uniref:F-box/LRR-repeat protein 6-like n=1 Tax=Panonychus citri TaxID=50023 RepID=UPI0023079602|nr:F-box/LRR-repeat protein 6-like [Panonychus citri]
MGESRVLFSLGGELWPEEDDDDQSWEDKSCKSDKGKQVKGKGEEEGQLAGNHHHHHSHRHHWRKNSKSKTEKQQPLPPEPPPVSIGTEKLTSPEKDASTEEPPTSKLGQEVPIKDERILLKMKKIKKRSGDEDYYDYQITDQKEDDDKRPSKKKKEVDEAAKLPNNVGNTNCSSTTTNNSTGDSVSVKSSQLILKDFFETVDESNQVQTILPNEILVKIFEFVVQDESKVMINLLNLCRVCETWRQIILSSPKLWRSVDLSEFNKKPSETELAQLSSLLVNTSYLNFTGWEYSLTLPCLARILTTCGKSLTSIVLRGCYTVDGAFLDLLSDECPLLAEIDLSRTSPSDQTIKKGRNCNKVKKTSYPLFPSFQNYLAKNGSKLKSLNLSENKINGLTHVFTAITKYCLDLRSLDLSNIQSSSSFLLRVDTLQESCPNLQILRLGNIFIQPPKSGNARGFPKLEELSIPCNNSDHGYSESVISSLTKDAENLKLLDIRGSPRVTASCIIKISAWNLQHLAIDNCSTIFSTGLENIINKWKHSLIELDISHNLHQEGISDALEALSSVENCPLTAITLRGSSVLFNSIEKLLRNCKNLRLIDLQSCRALPRGTKRVFVGEEVVAFRNDIINGRYKDFDQ